MPVGVCVAEFGEVFSQNKPVRRDREDRHVPQCVNGLQSLEGRVGTSDLTIHLKALAACSWAGSLIMHRPKYEVSMELGHFSISLAVKDIDASRLFYEKLGFTMFAGDRAQNWLIVKNGDRAIGLFQGMFDKTF